MLRRLTLASGMKSVIVHADGRRIDLAGAISAELYEELEGTHSPRVNPKLYCGGCHGSIYIRHGSVRTAELFGAHHDAGNCAQRLAIHKASAMSDEHKRMQEYHVAALTSSGHDAAIEVPTSGRTRVDVVADGRIGFEVQLSALTAGAAVDRTGRSMAAGLECVAWCAEKPSVAWRGKVPGYQWLDNAQFQAGMPRPRSVRCSGVASFRAEREGRPVRWVPVLDPQTALADEVIAWLADGSVRPVMYAKNVQLIKATGLTLYEELTGTRLAPFVGRPPRRALGSAPPAECLRPPAQRRSPELHPAVRVCEVSPCDEENVRPYDAAEGNGTVWLCPGHARQRAREGHHARDTTPTWPPTEDQTLF